MDKNKNMVKQAKPQDVSVSCEYIHIFMRPQKIKVSLHTHEQVELVYVYNGEGILNINGEFIKVGPGDLLFYNIGELHCLNSEDQLTAVNILISPQILDQSLATSQNAMDFLALAWFRGFSGMIQSFKPKVSFNGKDRLEIEAILSRALEEYSNKKIGYLTVLFGYLNVLFAKLFRQIYQETHMNLLDDIPAITDEVLRYMEENYHKKLTLHELAQRSFYHPTYFSSLFKECFGISPMQYIHHKRIEKAITLLETTDMPVDRIMRSVGYFDKKHFYSQFKQIAGLTPGSYRKK